MASTEKEARLHRLAADVRGHEHTWTMLIAQFTSIQLFLSVSRLSMAQPHLRRSD
jgi:hypothetical protein